MAHVPTYSSAPAWLTILGERHPLQDGCRVLFQPTFHAPACLAVERLDDLAVVRLRTLPRAAAHRYFWSGGRLLSPGPDDVALLPHTAFEAPIAADHDIFAAAPDLRGPGTDRFARDGMPTTTTLWRAGRDIATRTENTPHGEHLALCLRALDLAHAHLPDPRARTCLAVVRRYLD